jgi:hypothetical protein
MSKDGVMGAAPSAGDMYHAPVSDLMIQQQHNHAKAKSEAAELAANAHLQSQVNALCQLSVPILCWFFSLMICT